MLLVLDPQLHFSFGRLNHERANPRGSEILAAAERQMQAWSMTASIEDRGVRMKDFQQLTDSSTAISRFPAKPARADARSRNRRPAARLEVLGKELLDRIASDSTTTG